MPIRGVMLKNIKKKQEEEEVKAFKGAIKNYSSN